MIAQSKSQLDLVRVCACVRVSSANKYWYFAAYSMTCGYLCLSIKNKLVFINFVLTQHTIDQSHVPRIRYLSRYKVL